MSHKNHSLGRVLLGLLFIVSGGLIILDNLDIIYFDFFDFLFQWEIIVITIGLIILISSRDYFTGLLLIAVGSIFYTSDYYDLSVGDIITDYWPLIFILLGFSILFKRGTKKFQGHSDGATSEDTVDHISVFSGKTLRISSQSFKGGKITNILGGTKLDLIGAKLNKGTNILDIVAIFGGVDFFVPENMHVSLQVTTIFGGFDDKRFHTEKPSSENESALVVKGLVIFGGGTIKSI